MSQQYSQNNPYIDDALTESQEQYSSAQNQQFIKQYNPNNDNEDSNEYNRKKHNKKSGKGRRKKKKYDANDHSDDDSDENNTKITKQNGDVLRMTKIPKDIPLEAEHIQNLFHDHKVNITKFEIVEFRRHKYRYYHPCSIYIQFDSNNSRENAMKYIENLKKNETIKKKDYNLKYSSWKFKERKPHISAEKLQEREMKKEEIKREKERKKEEKIKQREEAKRIKLEKKLEKERRKIEAENERLRREKELEEERKKWEREEAERIRKEIEQREKERKIRAEKEKEMRIKREKERKRKEEKEREMRMKLEKEQQEKIRIKKQKEEKLRIKLENEQKHLKNKVTIKKLPKLKVSNMRKQRKIKKNKLNNIDNNDEKKEENDMEEKEEKEMFEIAIDGFIDAKDRQKQLEFKRVIIFVIDVSGSMSGSRINEIKSSVIPFVCKMVTNDKETVISIITFCDHAQLYENINKYDVNTLNYRLNNILSAGGGTNFYVASTKLVECANKWYKDYSIQIILLSDGEVSKDNAQKAHLHWNNFVENKYILQHDMYPFVESIGIGLEHDADILDGFICNDEYGNYTQTKKSNEISIALNRSSMDATFRVGYKLRIESEFPFLINLYTQKTSKIYEMFITKMEYLRKFWVFKNDINSTKQNVIKLNNQKVIIEAMIENDTEDNKDNNNECELEEKEIINEQIIGYHYQLLKDMIDHLRQFKDEIRLKNEAQKIQSKLYELKYIFGEIISNKNKINIVQNEGNKVNIIDKLNETLNSLQLLLTKIIDGKNINIQEIRQNILLLHFGQSNMNQLNQMNTPYV